MKRWIFVRDVVYDGTLGFGGHASAILKLMDDDSLYIGVDRDPEAIAHCQRLFQLKQNVKIVHAVYSEIEIILSLGWIRSISCCLIWGYLHQLDESERSFQFSSSEPLDMRMDAVNCYGRRSA